MIGLHHFIESDVLMATLKPRITISLDEQDYAILKRLSALNGVPMSRTVSELVSMLAPVLGRMADNLEAVVKADEETRKKILESAEKHFIRTTEFYNAALKDFDRFSDKLGEQVEGMARNRDDSDMRVPRGRVGAVACEAPDCVTRGSGTLKSTRSGG